MVLSAAIGISLETVAVSITAWFRDRFRGPCLHCYRAHWHMSEELIVHRYEQEDVSDALNWPRILGIAFVIALHLAALMLLLIPAASLKAPPEKQRLAAVTIVDSPPPPPPPPPQEEKNQRRLSRLWHHHVLRQSLRRHSLQWWMFLSLVQAMLLCRLRRLRRRLLRATSVPA